MNTADALVSSGHRVVVWSSAYSHQERRHRARGFVRIPVSDRLEYRLVPSPGYGRNLGVRRLWDHAVLAANLRRALDGAEPPDACIVGYPPIEVATIMTLWLKRHGVPSLLDIKDQWPMLFLEPAPRWLRPLLRLALTPYYVTARRAMREASGLSTMSESYLRWARAFAGRQPGPYDLVAPLTRPQPNLTPDDLQEARRWWAERGVIANDHPRFCFVGSHTRSFDFEAVVDAAESLAASHPEASIIVCGSGDRSHHWRRAAAKLGNVHFPGWINEAQMQALSEACLAFIAPYVPSPGFDSNIPNKIVDALALGLPIVTCLGGEVADLIMQHGVGLRYGRDEPSLHECLALLIDDPSLRDRQATAARSLYESTFTYERVYGSLTAHLERMASGLVAAADG